MQDDRDAIHIRDAKDDKDADNREDLGTGTLGSAKARTQHQSPAVTRTPKVQVQLQKQG
jgi:hypothetical protein